MPVCNFYCVRCKSKMDAEVLDMVVTKNNRMMARGICDVCGTTLNRFISYEIADELGEEGVPMST